MMKRKGIWISLLIGVLVCVIAGGVVWWRQQHPQPYCITTQNGSRTIEYKMCTDKERYQFGESIHMTFTIKNISGDTDRKYFGPLEFDNSTGPAMDICDPWLHACWSDERNLTEDDKHFVLKLRESRTLTWTWPTTSEHFDYIEERIATNYDERCFAGALAGCEAWASSLECTAGPWIVYGECSGFSMRR